MLKKKNIIKLTLKQLVLSGIHVGSSKNSLHNELKAFVFGHYNHFFLINLYYTSFQLKLLSNLIINLVYSRQKVMFVKSTGFGSFRTKFDNVRMDSLLVFDYSWIGGFFTNFKHVRHCWLKKDAFLKKSDKSKLSAIQRLQLLDLVFMPSLVVFFDNYSQDIMKETSYLDMPMAGIVDTNSGFFNLLNYPIVGNNSSYNSLFLYYNFFYNSILRGIQKEYFKLLSVKGLS